MNELIEEKNKYNLLCNFTLEHFIQKLKIDEYTKFLQDIYTAVKNRETSYKNTFILNENNCEKNFLLKFDFEYLTDNEKLQNMDIIIKHSISEVNNSKKSCIFDEEIDDLTKLKNRSSFDKHLENILKQKPKINIALAIVDMDEFSLINNFFGTDFGDEVLVDIAKKLVKIFGNKNVFRFFGDEFVVCLNSFSSLEFVEKQLEIILKTLNANYENEVVVLSQSANIGAVIIDENMHTLSDVYNLLEVSLNKSREMGKNNFMIFSDLIDSEIAEELMFKRYFSSQIEKLGENLAESFAHSEKHIEAEEQKKCKTNILNNKKQINLTETKNLKNNVSHGFRIYLQPQFEVATGKLSGFETLARLESDVFGVIKAAAFISYAVDSGLIVQLGRWIIKETLKTIKEFQRLGYKNLNLSCNFSIEQFKDEGIVEFVNEVIREINIKPSRLQLEIKESELVDSLDEKTTEILNSFISMGITIILADFGSGKSSKIFLQRFPISVLKINKPYVDNINTVVIDKEIVRGIVELSHALGIKTIAEGVETKNQLDVLNDLKCDIAQGFLYGQPMDKNKVFEIIDTYI